MNDQNSAPTNDTDDVQGHIRVRAGEERDETADEVEGQIAKFGVAESLARLTSKAAA